LRFTDCSWYEIWRYLAAVYRFTKGKCRHGSRFFSHKVEDLLDCVGQSKYLTKLDMTRGYWQVPFDEESVPISAFVTSFGHFEWRHSSIHPSIYPSFHFRHNHIHRKTHKYTQMPFGLGNAPFSRQVLKLLQETDDIISFSDT